MKSGVYILRWDETPYYYIGSSTDIEKRHKTHISSIKNNKHSRKVQSVANNHGMPKIEVLEFCRVGRLIKRERFFISSMDDKENCLNSVKASGKRIKAHSESDFRMKLKCI